MVRHRVLRLAQEKGVERPGNGLFRIEPVKGSALRMRSFGQSRSTAKFQRFTRKRKPMSAAAAKIGARARVRASMG